MAAVICRLFGSLILIAVIASLLPVTVPRFMGYGIYSVVSGSMEPELPVGSIAYVKPEEPALLQEGDVIAFQNQGSVVMHRVVANHPVDKVLTTKGDANEIEDFGEVRYEYVIGRVEKHYPMLGQVMMICTAAPGRILLLCLAVCGVLLHVLAGRFAE